MQFILDNGEIEEALVSHVRNQGIDLANKTVKLNFTAGRGSKGNSVAITILPETEKTTEDGEPDDSDPVFS